MNESAVYIGATVCKGVSALSGLPGARCYDAAVAAPLGFSVVAVLLIAFFSTRALKRIGA